MAKRNGRARNGVEAKRRRARIARRLAFKVNAEEIRLAHARLMMERFVASVDVTVVVRYAE